MNKKRAIAVLKLLAGETLHCDYCAKQGKRDMSCNECQKEVFKYSLKKLKEGGKKMKLKDKYLKRKKENDEMVELCNSCKSNQKCEKKNYGLNIYHCEDYIADVGGKK